MRFPFNSAFGVVLLAGTQLQQVPDQPGWGVTLDAGLVAKYTVN